jgi:ATP:ADP antiporter, AAA family
MRRYLLHLLNVKPHETKLVQQLFLVQFFLVMGASFLLVTSNAVFLPVYTAAELPRAFLISGIFLLIANRIYGIIEHRFGVKKQLIIMISGIAVITLIIWIALQISRNNITIYALFVWNNIVYLLSNLLFWGLAAILFDVRESRRIFTIIGAGDIPARLLGYLSVSVVAPYIGLHNMIWISVVAFIISILFLQRFFRQLSMQLVHHTHTEHEKKVTLSATQMLKKFFGSDLIISISILSLLTFATLILVDFSFLSAAQVRYHTEIELASFLGVFFAFGTCLALILKLTLSSRLIDRLGMVWALLLSPLVLLFFTVIILLISRSAYFSGELLYLLGFMTMLTEILKSIIQEPVFLVLFQPLKPALRLRGHYIAKGYMLPLAYLLIGGGLIICLYYNPHFSVTFFSSLLLLLLLAWALSVFIVKRTYLETLHHTLKSGFFRGNELSLKEHAIQQLLIEKTGSINSSEALYALDLLEKSRYEHINDLLRQQLEKKDKTILFYSLDRLAFFHANEAIPDIESLLQRSVNSEVKARCLRTLGILHPDFIEKFMHYLHSEDILCRQAAVTGLIISDDLNALLIAGKQLLELIQSDESALRMQAASIIAETEKSNFYKTLKTLLTDTDIQVQKEAIKASGKIKNPLLLPVLAGLIKEPALQMDVQQALIEYGGIIFEHFNYIFNDKDHFLIEHLIAVAGKINSEQSTSFLLQCLQTYPEYEKQIVNYLWEKDYAALTEEKQKWIQMVQAGLNEAMQVLSMKEKLQLQTNTTSLVKSLTEEVSTRTEYILKLLSFIYDRSKINQVIYVAGLNDKSKLSNALEMLEMIIPREIFFRFHQLAEKNISGIKHEKLSRSQQKINDLMENIISNKTICFNDWTRAMAMTVINAWQHKELLRFLHTVPDEQLSFILRETKAFVISGK